MILIVKNNLSIALIASFFVTFQTYMILKLKKIEFKLQRIALYYKVWKFKSKELILKKG